LGSFQHTAFVSAIDSRSVYLAERSTIKVLNHQGTIKQELQCKCSIVTMSLYGHTLLAVRSLMNVNRLAARGRIATNVRHIKTRGARRARPRATTAVSVTPICNIPSRCSLRSIAALKGNSSGTLMAITGEPVDTAEGNGNICFADVTYR
jgi:hypothetical protein